MGLAPIGVPVGASLAIASRRSDGNSVANLLVDTGFLVALYRRNDELHQSALRFLQGNREGSGFRVWRRFFSRGRVGINRFKACRPFLRKYVP